MATNHTISKVTVDSFLDDELLEKIKPVTELIVDGWGTFISKHSERLIVTRKGQPPQEASLSTLQAVFISGQGVSFSSDVVEECAKRGIPIHFIDFSGKSLAGLYSSQLTGTVKTRREQLKAYSDERGVILAKAFASGKIHNQINLLRYMSKNRVGKDPVLLEEVKQTVADMEGLSDELKRLAAPNIDSIREQVLSLEGRAAVLYWEKARKLLLVEAGWSSREGQGATDLVNSLLNYGYGILYSRIENALLLAGLDPYGGFTHTDRPGKPSLVFDLIEEFRQPVVDRVVFALLNLKMNLQQDEAGLLIPDTRRLLAKKILERLSEGREQYESKKQTLQYILFSQARHLATYVRGDLGRAYTAFECGW